MQMADWGMKLNSMKSLVSGLVLVCLSLTLLSMGGCGASENDVFVATWELVDQTPGSDHMTKVHAQYNSAITIEYIGTVEEELAGEKFKHENVYAVITRKYGSEQKSYAKRVSDSLEWDTILHGNSVFSMDENRLKLTWKVSDQYIIEAWYERSETTVQVGRDAKPPSLPEVVIADPGGYLIKKSVMQQSGFSFSGPRREVRFGYIDRNGTQIIEPAYTRVWDFVEGRALVESSGGQFFIDTTGEPVFDPKGGVSRPWLFSYNFSEGLAAVAQPTQGQAGAQYAWGYIDRDGKVVIEPQFGETQPFSDGLAAVKAHGREGKWGYIDKTGASVITQQFSTRPGSFCDGLAVVSPEKAIGGRKGYINKTGELVIPAKFLQAHDFSCSVARVEAPTGSALIDTSGQVILAPADQFITEFAEGRALIRVDRKYGFADASGAIVIEAKFDQALSFSEGLAAVCIGGKWGYVDRSGAVVIERQYDAAGQFRGGLALVNAAVGSGLSLFNAWGPTAAYIDRDGKTVWKSSQ